MHPHRTHNVFLTLGLLLLSTSTHAQPTAQPKTLPKASTHKKPKLRQKAWSRKAMTVLAKKHGRFPKIQGTTLAQTKRNLPAALPGPLNLVMIAFARAHQKSIQSWLPNVKRLCQKHTNLDYMTIPVMNGFARLFRGLIEGGMRKTYKSKKARSRTMPLYSGRDKFQKLLRLKNTKQLVLVLTDRKGRVFWRAKGMLHTATLHSLKQTLKKLRPPTNQSPMGNDAK